MRRFFITKKYLFTLVTILSLATIFCAGYHPSFTTPTKTDIIYPVIIVGGGIGGLCSSVFLASKGISPLVLEGELPGGQLTFSSSVRNWPTITDLSGEDIVKKIRDHAQKLNVQIISTNATKITRTGDYFTVTTPAAAYKTFNIIAATGTTPKRLNIPGESTFWGNGISDCAVCDGGLYQQKTVAVVGGGQSAIEEALHLSTIAKKVFVIVRKSALRSHEASRLESLKNKSNITFLYDSIVTSAQGTENRLNSISVLNTKSQKQSNIQIDGLFLAIGSNPNSALFKDLVECDANGSIKVDHYGKSSEMGIFAIGDVTPSKYRQAIMVAEQAAITTNKICYQHDKTKSFYSYSPDDAIILEPQNSSSNSSAADYHVVFVGANPAAYTAAIYLQHAGYKTAIIKTPSKKTTDYKVFWPGMHDATQATIQKALEIHAKSAGSSIITDVVIEEIEAFPYQLNLQTAGNSLTAYFAVNTDANTPIDTAGLQEITLSGIGARIGLQISEKLQELMLTKPESGKTSISPAKPQEPQRKARPSTIPHIKTTGELNNILKENNAVFIDCYAHWCPPCKRLKPLLEKIYTENRYPGVYIACVDVDEAENIAQALGVQSLPTLLSFKQGRPVNKSLGFKNEFELRQLIEKLL
jgi:thioredoxin reductase (NADPH)